MSKVECRITEEGFLFSCNGKGMGPLTIEELQTVGAVDIAKELDTDAKAVNDAKWLAMSEVTQREITIEELQNVLGLTVKHDDVNKTITFLCMLATYTDESQFNISFRAESSTGKSYIPIELMQLFPQEDRIEIAYSSPKAFFHAKGDWDKDKQVLYMHLDRKILIFFDQPHDMLLQYLRPLLSHDQKELLIRITDKSEKKGLRTKDVIIIGYPSVIFCSAKLRVDDQESTRTILLSPETSEAKLSESIRLRALRESNSKAFHEWLDRDLRRYYLKERIQKIKSAGIGDVIISNSDKIADRFMQNKRLMPRYQRDIVRVISIAKALALLNLWNRERKDTQIIANDSDIENAFMLYDKIGKSQELGIAPYVYAIYSDIIKPLDSNAKYAGVPRKAIIAEHFKKYGRPLSDWRLKNEILPSLESAGLINQQSDPADRRNMLVYTKFDSED